MGPDLEGLLFVDTSTQTYSVPLPHWPGRSSVIFWQPADGVNLREVCVTRGRLKTRYCNPPAWGPYSQVPPLNFSPSLTFNAVSVHHKH